jgi:hypothetical protein
MYECTAAIREGIFKLLRKPGIDSQESTPLAYVAWRAGMSNRVAGLTSPPGWGNRFLGSLKGLQIRAQDSVTLTFCLTLPLSQQLKICTIIRCICTVLYMNWYILNILHNSDCCIVKQSVSVSFDTACSDVTLCPWSMCPYVVSGISHPIYVLSLGRYVPERCVPTLGREAVVMWGL